MKWIPVSVRLPDPHDKKVLVWNGKDVLMSRLGGWNGDQWENDPDSYYAGGGYITGKVTHWMELPTAPKAAQAGKDGEG